MTIREDVDRYVAGDVSAEDLAKGWALRTFEAPVSRSRQAADVYDRADDRGFRDGTWDEVKRLWVIGVMTDDEYFALSEAVDRRAGAG